MRVAHLTTVDSSLRFLLFAQLQALRDAGHEPLGISAPGPWVAGLEADGICHLPLPSSTRGFDPLADLRTCRELWALLRRTHVDVLHTHNPKPGLYGRVLGRLAGVPVIVNTVHGLYATEEDRLAKRAVVYALEAIAARFSDAELVQNPEDYDLLRRYRLVPPSRLCFLGNGVDLRRFDPSRFTEADRARTRSDLDIEPDRVVVGMVGRLVAEKGYPELLAAAAALDDRFVFLCIGPEDLGKADGLRMGDLRSAAGSNVRFLGFRDDVAELYRAMDIFVLPSHREGVPRAAMEAAAMGLPVIASDVRGCRQVVADGETGQLVPVRDAEALARAIRRFGDDPAWRARAGSAGRRRASEEFDEDRIVERVIRTYERLAARRRPRVRWWSTRTGGG